MFRRTIPAVLISMCSVAASAQGLPILNLPALGLPALNLPALGLLPLGGGLPALPSPGGSSPTVITLPQLTPVLQNVLSSPLVTPVLQGVDSVIPLPIVIDI